MQTGSIQWRCRESPLRCNFASCGRILALVLRSIRWQLVFMGYALAKEQQTFINRLVKSGKFNNQSEAVREAIRRMERQENDYLTPPPLSPAQVETIYGKSDKQADTVGRGAFKALRTAARKGARS